MQITSKRKIAALALLAVLFLIGRTARAEEGPNIYYKEGTHIDSADGKNTLKVQGRFAARFTEQIQHGQQSTDTFSIPAGEIRMEGNVFTQRLLYGFEMNLATRSSNSTATVCSSSGTASGICPGATATAVSAVNNTGVATLNDFYFDWLATDTAGIKAGQFKVPFLMQQLTSSTKQQFVDRSNGTLFFDLGRDIGASVHGDLFDYRANYSVFLMNGDGANAINPSQSVLAGTRIEVPILGKYEASESDVGYSDHPNLGLGIAYALNKRAVTVQGTIPGFTYTNNGTLDVGYKYHGLSVQLAGMITKAQAPANLTNYGYSGQAGYFIIPKHLEVAARSSGVITSGATADQWEHMFGINYYVAGHPIKFQTDFALLRNTSGQIADMSDFRVRTQMRVIF